MKPTNEPCFSQGEKVKYRRTTIAICGPAGILSEDQIEANAEFIADAFTVYHETGLTPREILSQRDELSRAVENARQIIASLAEGESCDHDAGICYCDTTKETPCH